VAVPVDGGGGGGGTAVGAGGIVGPRRRFGRPPLEENEILLKK